VAHQQVDILIIGGGLIGAALMLALKDQGYKTLLVETKPFVDEPLDFDARSLALSPASQRILQNLNLWSYLAPFATTIETIHVSEAGRFGATRLQGDKNNPLGHVIEMHYLQSALQHSLSSKQILAPAKLLNLDSHSHQATISTNEGNIIIEASLIVAADGAHSIVRQLCQLPYKIKNYHQTAIIANIGLTKTHQQQAFERFTADGPLAFLPLPNNRAALVWTMQNRDVENYLTMSDKQFLIALQKIFGYRLGRLDKIGHRFSYPLQQIIMPEKTAWPVVFIGNAAQTLHPVAGQGFNLGLRDVATLAQTIQEQGLTEKMLNLYKQRRQHDERAIVFFTDGLVELFTAKFPGLALARNAGLIALDNSPLLKTALTHYARGFGGYASDLICQNSAIKEKL
jgi:2-octaprenyl-6-methoxyphenol hydroxylase